MTRKTSALWRSMRHFTKCESGVVTVEFVIVFPLFLMFFLMTYESGMISLRNVMLERGVDIAVREVRIGRMANPTRERLRERICEVAQIIPDCVNQMELEMIRRNPRSWTAVDPNIKCIDKSLAVQPVVEFTNGGNNELLILRACARFDPSLGAGKLLLIGNAIRTDSTPQAAGTYALVAVTAFVVEPFNR